MFESLTKHTCTDNSADVHEMIWEALKHGRPAACHKSELDIFLMLKNDILSAFEAGRSWIDYDWKFQDGRAFGRMSFHSDGTLYGCYHFVHMN